MIKRKNLNVNLKNKYPMVLKESLIITLLIFITAFYFKPEIIHNNVRIGPLIENRGSEIITPDITFIDPPTFKRPATPIIPIEASGDEGLMEIDDILDGLQTDVIFEPGKIPVFDVDDVPVPSNIFIPFTQEPEPIGGFAAIQRNVIYPEIAQEADIEGTVYIRAYIDKKGDVTLCEVLKGYEGTGLNEAAIAAIQKTKFKPALQRDKKVGVWISIPVVFKLR